MDKAIFWPRTARRPLETSCSGSNGNSKDNNDNSDSNDSNDSNGNMDSSNDGDDDGNTVLGNMDNNMGSNRALQASSLVLLLHLHQGLDTNNLHHDKKKKLLAFSFHDSKLNRKPSNVVTLLESKMYYVATAGNKFKYYPFVKNSSLNSGGGEKMYTEKNLRNFGRVDVK